MFVLCRPTVATAALRLSLCWRWMGSSDTERGTVQLSRFLFSNPYCLYTNFTRSVRNLWLVGQSSAQHHVGVDQQVCEELVHFAYLVEEDECVEQEEDAHEETDGQQRVDPRDTKIRNNVKDLKWSILFSVAINGHVKSLRQSLDPNP